jgi:hypothetical protein
MSNILVSLSLQGSNLLEPISKTPKQQLDAAELEEAEEVVGIALIPHDQPPEVAQMCEQALNLPAPSVAPELPAVLRLKLLTVAAMRRNQLNAKFCEFGV